MKRLTFLVLVNTVFLLVQLDAAERRPSKPAKTVVTGIKFEVIPAENTFVFIDGKKIGEVSKLDVVPVKPGKHLLKIVHNKDEVEVEVFVANKQILNFKYAFEDSGKGISGFSEEEKEATIDTKDNTKGDDTPDKSVDDTADKERTAE